MTKNEFRVLVIDDEPSQRTPIRRVLERHGFDVAEAADAATALRLSSQVEFDMALVDIHLPDMSGFDLLPQLRKLRSDVHLTVLSGEGAEADRVRGLAAGADDYLVKPCSLGELTARVGAVARRRLVAAPKAAVHLGPLDVDAQARIVRRDGVEIELTRREFDLLEFLAAHLGRAFNRTELLSAVWSSSPDWQTPATVTEHVRRLRLKLESDPSDPKLIETVPGVGYRFAVPVTDDITAGAPALNHADDAVAIIEGTTVEYVSDAMRTLLALDGDLVGGNVFDVVAPESVDAVRARHQSVADGTWPRPETITMLRGDGERVHVELSSMPVLFRGSLCSQVTVWPVAAPDALRQAITGIATEVADAVIITNAELVIQSFNAAAEQMYGWTEAEVVGRLVTDVITWRGTHADLDTAASALFVDGRWHGEVEQERRDGSTLSVRATTTLVRDSAGAVVGVISVNRPITTTLPVPSAAAGIDRALIEDLERGIAADELVVLYQPNFDLHSFAPIGAEALVRWQHPERGLLLPGTFIHAAEMSGAIVPMGEIVLDAACEQAKRWRDAGSAMHVSVNVSTRQLADEHLVDRFAAIIEAREMPPRDLWLEVTETALVEDLARAEATLRGLKELGFHIAIDDFGTGWASLTYLHQFPVDALKVDQIFVAGLGISANDTAIVRSIISLGHELGLDVVAEGVETPLQLSLLREFGCSIVQGFLLGGPGPASDIDVSRAPQRHAAARRAAADLGDC